MLSQPSIPMPRSWSKHVKSSLLHAISVPSEKSILANIDSSISKMICKMDVKKPDFRELDER